MNTNETNPINNNQLTFPEVENVVIEAQLNEQNETVALQPVLVQHELNELMSVSLMKGNAIQVTDEFSLALNQISEMVQSVERLTNVDIATIQEDELDTNMKELAEAQKLRKLVAEARKSVRKEFDAMRDTNISQLDSKLAEAGFEALEKIDKDTKKLKEDIRAHRINQHWEDLRPVFDATIQTFDAISRIAPSLADFSTFRIRNPKLVTGAKSFKVTDKHRTEVNNEMNMINQNLLQIEENRHGLAMQNQQNLLNDFLHNPTNENFLARQSYYIDLDKAQKQAEIQRQEQERLKQEQLEQQRLLQQQQQAQPSQSEQEQLNQMNQQPPVQQQWNQQQPPQNVTMFNQQEAFARPQATNEFAWLAELSTLNPEYRNLATNERTKMAVLYDLFHKLTDSNTVFGQNVGTDVDKVMKTVRYIIDL